MEGKLTESDKMAGNADSEPTYITIAATEDLVQLVRESGGQIQEVHVTDEQGNVQEIAYTYSTGASSHPQDSNLETLASISEQKHASFEYHDNARGKINRSILDKLVNQLGAEDSGLTKPERLERWNEVTEEYNKATSQNKSRLVLMKRWSSKTFRAGDKLPLTYDKPTSKRPMILKTSSTATLQDTDITSVLHNDQAFKKSALIKQLKEYDLLRLESAKMQKTAASLQMENATLENDALRKENAILDLHLEAARLQLALIKQQVQSTAS